MKPFLIGIFFYAVGGVIIILGINSMMKDSQAKFWPTVEGTVISSKCVYYASWDDGSSYFTHVKYQYSVVMLVDCI